MEPLYLGEQVQFYRALRGLRQEDVGVRLTPRRQKGSISKIEGNDLNIPLSTVRQLADLFGVPVASLFTPPSLALEPRAMDRLLPLMRYAHTLPDHVLQALVLIAHTLQEAQVSPGFLGTISQVS